MQSNHFVADRDLTGLLTFCLLFFAIVLGQAVMIRLFIHFAGSVEIPLVVRDPKAGV